MQGLALIGLLWLSCSCNAFSFSGNWNIGGLSKVSTVGWGRVRRSTLVMKDSSKKSSILSNLGSKVKSGLRGSEEKHPSERDHISPLNRLHPSLMDQSEYALPIHPEVKSGVLPNGFSYIILPNRSPPGRFEAHLQVFSGSSDELESQQGIAHLTEHVAYMGSRKRERLFGTGSQTNAYTDFHHTVFYAACPTQTPRGGAEMLPMALDALCDVMEAKVEGGRLEKERAAVLSEMTMVNTIEYRVECQILSTLHRENRLAKRFPIGKESLIRTWSTDDVKTWHRQHYRPDNVLLYLVGDINPEEAEVVINDKFAHLSASKNAKEMNEAVKPLASDLADGVMQNTVKSSQSWHYPPIVHDWCVPLDTPHQNTPFETSPDYDTQLWEPYPLDEKFAPLITENFDGTKSIRAHIFRHELLQAFSLHLFAKRPVQPTTDLPSFKKSLARRVALAALQIRLNVGGRSDDPPFTFVEFNQLDSAREGCAVCSLDMTAEPDRWRDAITFALQQIRKLGVYGVTHNELERYAGSLMTDADQLAAQNDRISHADQLAFLMETVANNHVFMSPLQSYHMTEAALSSITLEDVNEAAKELCSHVTNMYDGLESPEVDGPMIVIACTPKSISEDSPSYCCEEGLIDTIYQACQLPVEAEEDVEVPHSLIPVEQIDSLMEEFHPVWLPGTFTDGTPDTPTEQLTRPFTLRRLENGIRIGVAKIDFESQRGHLRLVAPGGRDAEKRLGLKEGSMPVGARTMQEGGAFGPWSREQVELFCVDHLIMVEINCNEESLIIDFVFPTTNVGNTGFGENIELGITGTEAVLQIVREILVGFHWEEDALGRSKKSFKATHEGMLKNLEGLSTEMVMEAMTQDDKRFLSIDVDKVNDISLEEAMLAVMSQLQLPDIEISMAGDFDPSQILDLIKTYLGTIPSDVNEEFLLPEQSAEAEAFGSVPPLELPGRFLSLELPDSDPRAVAYVAGSAPNVWGYLSDGTTVAQRVISSDKKSTENDTARRSHPLFANVALALVSEIINRRLFSTVRERKQLTYDANFSLTSFERLKGGYFLVTVTASKEKAKKALEACKETLSALKKGSPITPDNLESAKRVVLNRHEGELRTTRYWAEMMSGLQQQSIPLKGPLSFTDFSAMVEAITTQDLQLTLDSLGFDEAELYTAIGQTVLPEGYEPEDDVVVSSSPVIGQRRGGALM